MIIFWYLCLCFTLLQQRGHLETAPPFTVPCEGRAVPTGNRTPGHRVAVHYATAAPRKLHIFSKKCQSPLESVIITFQNNTILIISICDFQHPLSWAYFSLIAIHWFICCLIPCSYGHENHFIEMADDVQCILSGKSAFIVVGKKHSYWHEALLHAFVA